MTKSTTRQAADVAHVVGRKNLIINGNFQVSQRGDFTTADTMSGGLYRMDRWVPYMSGIVGTLQHTSIELDGINYKAAKCVAINTSSGEMAYQQRIEMANIPSGSTVTASAMVRATNSNVCLRYYNGEGWTMGQHHTGDGSWQKLTTTFKVVDNVNGYYVVQLMSTQMNIGEYFEITNVQLELGSVATEFEHKSYGEELALCSRYFQVTEASIYATATAANQSKSLASTLVVSMRAVPTVTLGTVHRNSNVSTSYVPSSVRISDKRLLWRALSAGSGYVDYAADFKLDAEL